MAQRMRLTAVLLLTGLFIWLIPLAVLAGDMDGDGYHDGDAALLRTFLEQYGTDINRKTKNGALIGEGYTPINPATWAGVSWSDTAPRRITAIRWESKMIYGVLDLGGASALTSLICTGNWLMEVRVNDCAALELMSVENNMLSKLVLYGNRRLSYLNCSNNRLRELPHSEAPSLRTLYCQSNQLPFSQLPMKLPAEGGSYVYAPQSYAHIRLLSGQVVDLTKEAVIDGKETTFTWKDDKGVTLSGKDMTADRGRFSFWGENVGKLICCVMENPAFPALSGEAALKTDYVRVSTASSPNAEGFTMDLHMPVIAETQLWVYSAELTGSLNGTVSKVLLNSRLVDMYMTYIGIRGELENRLLIVMAAQPGASAAELEIPRSCIDRIAQKDRVSLQLETEFGSLLLDKDALAYVSENAREGNILLRVGKAGTFFLTEPIKSRVGYRPSATISIGTSSEQLRLVEGGVMLTLSYPTRSGETKEDVVAYEISILGSQRVSSLYDRDNWKVHIAANRLSTYAVAYLGGPVFSDVNPGDWFYEASAFVHDRGISAGRGDGSFGPDDPLTRGEFVFMLLKAYDIKPRSDEPDNFTDAGGEVYSPYLAAAKRMGVVEGMGDNRFMPEAKLTRQDMCTMLYRALQKLGKLPAQGTFTLSGYSDAEEVQGYAREAMAVLVREGIVSGYEGRLSPLETTTRAHMAQMLYNLLGKTQ